MLTIMKNKFRLLLPLKSSLMLLSAFLCDAVIAYFKTSRAGKSVQLQHICVVLEDHRRPAKFLEVRKYWNMYISRVVAKFLSC